jgi:polysaccharide deacetylase family protein (PEP-CTERM system associated)
MLCSKAALPDRLRTNTGEDAMTLTGNRPAGDPHRGGVINGLSVDIEDWFQVGAFENSIGRGDWDGLELRVEANTRRVMALFDRAGVKGTFFTLGWVAERVPALIRDIVADGHELASHGYDHKRVFQMSRAEFAADLAKAQAILEDIGGVAISGYRAPSFSIDHRTPWAHGVLADAGYAYSSSVAPVVHDHYGWPDSPRFAWQPLERVPLIELPVTTARLAGRTLAAGGGGFFRLLPYRFSAWAVRQVNAMGEPAMIYFHPWEVDPDQPRVADAPVKSKLRHYSRLDAMEGKLERLVSDFRWDRIDALVPHIAARLVQAQAA